jgi:hypothetical protein
MCDIIKETRPSNPFDNNVDSFVNKTLSCRISVVDIKCVLNIALILLFPSVCICLNQTILI